MDFPNPNKSLEEQDDPVLLAIGVWGEARGESPKGRTAVAHVILNRARLKKRSIADVLLAPWQFSCFNKADPNRDKIDKLVASGGKSISLGEWAVCWRAAVEALAGQTADNTGGATHYCVRKLWARPTKPGAKPKWHELPCIADGTTKRTAVIDSHVFATTKW